VTLGDQPVTDLEVLDGQGKLAMAIVTDLSPRMRDQGNPYKPSRFADMQSLLQEQMLALQSPGLQASLVVVDQEASLYYPMSEDIVGLSNIVNGSVPDKPFVPRQADEAEEGTYPLQQGVLLALEELAAMPPDMPRALVVYAAGAPEMALDSAQIEQALAAIPDHEHLLSMTIIALGSAEEGLFDTQPANPAALQQLADDIGATYFHYFAADIEGESQIQTDIKSHLDMILQHAHYHVLRFRGDETLSGPQELQISAGDASDTVQIEITGIPPRVNVVVDSRLFQDEVLLSVDPEFFQNELVHAEYLLDNRRIGDSDEAPNFAYTLDVYTDAFQQSFAPGEYELVVAVRDAEGLESRSEPLAVQVVQPPASSTNFLDRLFGSSSLIIIVVAVLGVGILGTTGIMYWRSRQTGMPFGKTSKTSKTGKSGKTGKTGKSGKSGYLPPPAMTMDDEPTGEFDEEMTLPVNTQDQDDDATQIYDEDLTLPMDRNGDAGDAVEHRFRVVIESGISDIPEPFELSGNGSNHYFIGRPSNDINNRPQIALPHPNVSRAHAKLVVLADGRVELIAGNSENGTFFGEDKQRVEANGSQILTPGDVFWISPAVKLRLEEKE
jgi:flagellar basal body-associated protein FliL